MVNWKAPDNIDRLIASLIAAHPSLKLEYQAMATLFGQGATYDAIEGRFRKYRKMADELKAEAARRGITDLPRGRNSSTSGASTPRTPRGPRSGGVMKLSTSASTGKGKKDPASRIMTSPTKRGGNRKVSGRTIMDAIFLDDGPDEDENDIRVKNETAGILSSIGGSCEFSDVEIVSPLSATTATTPITKIEESTAELSTMTNFSSHSAFGTVKIDQHHHHLNSSGFISAPADSRVSATTLASACGLTETSPLDSLGMGHDAFGMTGLYFSQSHGGYDMDDAMYGGTA